MNHQNSRIVSRCCRGWRHTAVATFLWAGLWLLRATGAYAQPPAPATPVVTITRSWYFEALIVAVMFGLALFVVCRSSRRN